MRAVGRTIAVRAVLRLPAPTMLSNQWQERWGRCGHSSPAPIRAGKGAHATHHLVGRDRDNCPCRICQTISEKKTGGFQMGGFGSGRPSDSGRDTVESCRSLDVHRVHETGCLQPGWSGGRQWSRDGKRTAWIGLRAEADCVHLRVRSTVVSGRTSRRLSALSECRVGLGSRLCRHGPRAATGGVGR
jgi:hypothetical protein